MDDPAGEEIAGIVVERVAARDGVAPTDLDQRLGDVIDPDALVELFDTTANERDARRRRLSFEYYGYLITVWGDGEVRVGADSEG